MNKKLLLLFAVTAGVALLFVLVISLPDADEAYDVAVTVEYPLAIQISGLERSASLGIIPATEFYPVGNRFVGQVYVDSTRMSMNAVETSIRYPVERLQIVSVSKENSILTLWPVEPVFDNTYPMGTLNFAGGLPNPGFQGNLGVLLDIEFEVVEEGVSVVEFKDSQVLANNGFGTDILKDLRSAVFTTRYQTVRKADVDGDGKIGFNDLSILLSNMWKNPEEFEGDINRDGRIDFQDLSIVLSEWGG